MIMAECLTALVLNLRGITNRVNTHATLFCFDYGDVNILAIHSEHRGACCLIRKVFFKTSEAEENMYIQYCHTITVIQYEKSG